jgi:hypothetical protein
VISDGRISIAGSVPSTIDEVVGGVFGPGSEERDDWPITSAPLDDVKIGTRLISACGLPISSHGSQMLYDAPISVGE